nr:immunoglobulin heavy chain junction region [Mus musculus]
CARDGYDYDVDYFDCW